MSFALIYGPHARKVSERTIAHIESAEAGRGDGLEDKLWSVHVLFLPVSLVCSKASMSNALLLDSIVGKIIVGKDRQLYWCGWLTSQHLNASTHYRLPE